MKSECSKWPLDPSVNAQYDVNDWQVEACNIILSHVIQIAANCSSIAGSVLRLCSLYGRIEWYFDKPTKTCNVIYFIN